MPEQFNKIEKPANDSGRLLGSSAWTFGGGLKRPLEVDDEGRPIIKKRQRITPARPHVVILNQPAEQDDSNSEWKGFSDSNNDDPSTSDDDNGDEEDNDGTATETSSNGENGEEDETANAISTFKTWATRQRNDALGFVPSADRQQEPPELPSIKYKPQPVEVEPLPPELQPPVKEVDRKVHSVYVERDAVIQEARMALPVVAEEQKIMEAIHNNDVVVICGATGSGKTTQVPQFLFEAGYGAKDGPTPGLIGVTQPRRVAAISMADRVGSEMGSLKRMIAYQIRFDASGVSQDTAVKFMTDGILFREISQDPSLSKYSAIVLDEAHERSVNTDILIAWLSRAVTSESARKVRQARNQLPLKLIIMSATLRINDFIENPRLFPQAKPPLVQAEGRQYPVTIHFARRTISDYVEETFKKICRGHRKLPKGGILVFLTGQNEIIALEKRLKQAFIPTDRVETSQKVEISAVDAPLDVEDMDIGKVNEPENEASDDEEVATRGHDDEDEDSVAGEEQEFDIGQTAEERQESSDLKVHVLPLYSQLLPKDQLRVFQPPPDGSRLIVLATNVAETSLTIPGIRYVFDCGRAKEKKYDIRSGVQSFEIGWISKASASQRAGRAGRTGPGHCYRLYSSALYESHFEEHTDPEILRTPMEGVVLQLRSLGIPNITNFPFPTAPERKSIEKAERLLQGLGAITLDGRVTDLGKRLSAFPLSPRYSRMLLLAQDRGCMESTIALVAALSVPELFIAQNQIHHGATNAFEDDETGQVEARKKAYRSAHAEFSKLDQVSDAIKLLAASRAYLKEVAADSSLQTAERFCFSHFLRPKGMKEVSQLRQQLTVIALKNRPGCVASLGAELPKPKDAEISLLRGIIAAGFVDQVAILADLAPVRPELPRKSSGAANMPYLTLFRSSASLNASETSSDNFVYVHTDSVLARRAPSKMPQFIIYSHLQRTESGRVRMHPLTPVSSAQLALLIKDTPLMELSKPIGKIETIGLDTRICECTVSIVGEKGSTPWPLRTWKVRQVRKKARGWVIEEILNS